MAVTDGLLDTSVLVGVLRRHAPALDWLRRSPGEWKAVVSVISVFELLAGCRTLSEQRATERRLSEFAVLPIS